MLGIDLFIGSQILFGVHTAIVFGAAAFAVAIFFWIGLAMLKHPRQRDEIGLRETAVLLGFFYGLWFGYTTWRARSLRA